MRPEPLAAVRADREQHSKRTHIGSIRLPPREGRDSVLVVADDSLGELLSVMEPTGGYDVLACATPLDAIQALIALGDRIAYVIIGAAWSARTALCELLADEFSEIQPVVVA